MAPPPALRYRPGGGGFGAGTRRHLVLPGLVVLVHVVQDTRSATVAAPPPYSWARVRTLTPPRREGRFRATSPSPPGSTPTTTWRPPSSGRDSTPRHPAAIGLESAPRDLLPADDLGPMTTATATIRPPGPRCVSSSRHGICTVPAMTPNPPVSCRRRRRELQRAAGHPTARSTPSW